LIVGAVLALTYGRFTCSNQTNKTDIAALHLPVAKESRKTLAVQMN
jgi:hypothetical protein